MTKLLVPKVRKEAIRSSKLTLKMKVISRYLLAIIHSCAGYGKSKVLALFICAENHILESEIGVQPVEVESTQRLYQMIMDSVKVASERSVALFFCPYREIHFIHL